ncbi:geranylgeranyl pyrophosphate synthase [Agromyces rhizosphaerae]|uniref:Geranylgeranyl pyrophosphate synthase n=1 Tax=Agromyces rhizosphaerae TaxID=88374 RepID=A0A9W6FST1_9MICO|nr:polyprenyl synthetase family protein [Agromyces rhizosphaerae]GLI29087.1 geranylgeranyl pyrophosphate synthase [Agromyces rhizosphaerae]
MPESSHLVDLVHARIDEFLTERHSILVSISPDLDPIATFSRRFLSGGKRFRALFCYWGWQAVHGHSGGFDPFAEDGDPETDPVGVVSVAAALECFHAAALVHDDIIDHSDTRRGAPAAHREFESLHREAGWDGDAAAFGEATAILVGDLLLGWADDLIQAGTSVLDDPARAIAARREFQRMRAEVTAGQYLDILEEQAWRSQPEAQLRPRAERVIVYKSARYSIEAPLRIGAALAGADPAQLAALSDFGLPLGIAYQLRDDLLGVFGDPATTGKPSGDDLREGKRTVLIAVARELLAPGQRRLLDELLGDPGLDAAQVEMLQETLRACGAVDEIERIISARVAEATAALEDAPLSRAARAELTALAETVARRER